MSALVPAAAPAVTLAAMLRAHATGEPVMLLERRHLPIHPAAQVLSVIGLTGDNVPVGFALGDVGSDVPHTVVFVGEPRDPALAVRAGARLADLLDPLVAAELADSGPMQLLIDGTNTADFLRAWTFRLRDPWLPGPYGRNPQLAAERERCHDAHALARAVLSAAKVPGADLLVTAVSALTDHLAFPLGGQQEAQQLPALLACLRAAGAPIWLPHLPPAAGPLIEQIEAAETVTVSAATDPAWDDEQLQPALSSFKRLRTVAVGANQLRRVDPQIVAHAAAVSGLDAVITQALAERHASIAQAFRLLRAIPELPGLGARRARAAWWITGQLRRGAAHERAWADFPSLTAAARDADRDIKLTAAAVIDAARGDRRAFAFAQARGEATYATATAVSADGRGVDLVLPRPLSPRAEGGWWWLDDPHPEPIAGRLEIIAPAVATARPLDGVAARLTVTRQMRRLAANPALLTGGIGAPGVPR